MGEVLLARVYIPINKIILYPSISCAFIHFPHTFYIAGWLLAAC
jgi:hypothetical protein